MDCYIRSYNEYVHEFKTKSGTVIVPAISARPKNIVKITTDQYNELIKNSAEFKALLEAKKHQFVKLDSMPRDALDADERIAQAYDKIKEANEAAEAARKEADKLKADKEALEHKLDMMGGIDAPVDKQVAEALAAKQAAIEEAENLRAELAAMKEKKAKK